MKIPTPIVTVISSTSVSVKIPSLPTMPTGDLWSSTSAYHVVYWTNYESKKMMAATGAVPLTKIVKDLAKFTSYAVSLHFYGKIDSSIEYNLISQAVTVTTLEDGMFC